MIGPRFVKEVRQAGLLGLPFSWSTDGTITGREALTPAQDAALQGVLDAHDPLAPGEPTEDETRRAAMLAALADASVDPGVPLKVRQALAALREVLLHG